MSSQSKRLAQYVLARRTELDLTQLDVWQSGGPSNTTLTQIEKGAMESLSRTTARKLDAGLQWEQGSARAVWAGGEPTPLGSRPARRLQDVVAEVQNSNMDPGIKEEVLRRIAEDWSPTDDNSERGTA